MRCMNRPDRQAWDSVTDMIELNVYDEAHKPLNDSPIRVHVGSPLPEAGDVVCVGDRYGCVRMRQFRYARPDAEYGPQLSMVEVYVERLDS